MKRKLSTLAVLISTLVTPFGFLQAQSSACTSNVAGESKAQLQADLDACNQEIAQWQSILNNTQQQSASYQRDVAALTAKINAAQASIKAKNIAIANLSQGIAEKAQTINVLNSKLESGHQSLSEILRKTNDLDSYTLAEAVLSGQDLSDFFADVDTYATTETQLQAVFDQLRGTRTEAQVAKDDLAKQKEETANQEAQIEQQKAQVESDQAQKKKLLADSQSKEKTYAQELAERQANAARIKAILFDLADTTAIPFGTALSYAQEVEKATGVPANFLLAILTQESNLGANVGACYLTNPVTGDGVSATTGAPKSRVMSPTRDVPVFQQILAAVGGDMTSTRVSCWQPIYSSSGSPIGWGGAMGAAQFIPSTWKLFTSRITRADGSANPNPWNARDAFFAAGLYLDDLGAGTGIYTDEKNAACKYYSGSSCKTSYANSYGNSVMAKAANIQTTMIDPLQNL